MLYAFEADISCSFHFRDRNIQNEWYIRICSDMMLYLYQTSGNTLLYTYASFIWRQIHCANAWFFSHVSLLKAIELIFIKSIDQAENPLHESNISECLELSRQSVMRIAFPLHYNRQRHPSFAISWLQIRSGSYLVPTRGNRPSAGLVLIYLSYA